MSFTTQKKKARWVIAYLVYDSSYYEEIMRAETDGHFPLGYKSMMEQTNALFHTVASLPPNDQISVLIFHLSCVFKTNTSSIRVIEKRSDADDVLDVVTKIPIQGMDILFGQKPVTGDEPLANATSIAGIFDYLTTHYSYDKLMVVTVGHGCLFGINLTSRRLFNRLLKIDTHDNPVNTPRPAPDKISLTWNKTYEQVFNDMKEEMETSATIGSVLKKVREMKEQWSSKIKFLSKKHEVVKLHKLADEIMEPSILTNRELMEGICTGLAGRKVNVLVMYNCLMQNIYAQYELKSCVDYLIAPVSGVGFPGYDYASVYHALCTNPDISSEAAAESFITAISASSYYEGFEDRIKKTWFIAATPLDEGLLEATKTAYTNWIADMVKTMKQNDKLKGVLSRMVVQTALQAYNLSANCIANLKVIDLFVFVSELLEKLKKTSRLPPVNQQALIASTEALLDCTLDLSARMKKCFDTDAFYGLADTEFYTDRKYKEERGIGIILSLSQFISFDIINMIFGGPVKDKMIPDIVPAFLDGSQTKELMAAVRFPY